VENGSKTKKGLHQTINFLFGSKELICFFGIGIYKEEVYNSESFCFVMWSDTWKDYGFEEFLRNKQMEGSMKQEIKYGCNLRDGGGKMNMQVESLQLIHKSYNDDNMITYLSREFVKE